MATEVAPEGGDAPRTGADGTGRDDPGSLSGGGVERPATAGGGFGAGAGSGSGGVAGAEEGPGRGAVPGQGAWDDVVLDEDFIRDAETAEPSARARMLAARWRQEAPDPQPWRSDEPPAGWFFSKARRRRWRRR